MLFLQDRMQHPKRFEDTGARAEVEALVLREQTLEDELVRSGSAQADIGVLVADDLVVSAVVNGRKARFAERRQRISGNRRGIALADDDDGGHAEVFWIESRRNRRARKSKLYAVPQTRSRTLVHRWCGKHRHRRQAGRHPCADRIPPEIGDR